MAEHLVLTCHLLASEVLGEHFGNGNAVVAFAGVKDEVEHVFNARPLVPAPCANQALIDLVEEYLLNPLLVLVVLELVSQ